MVYHQNQRSGLIHSGTTEAGSPKGGSAPWRRSSHVGLALLPSFEEFGQSGLLVASQFNRFGRSAGKQRSPATARNQ